jgi:hypothetical protein
MLLAKSIEDYQLVQPGPLMSKSSASLKIREVAVRETWVQ